MQKKRIPNAASVNTDAILEVFNYHYDESRNMNNRETHRTSEFMDNNNTYLIMDYLGKKKEEKRNLYIM